MLKKFFSFCGAFALICFSFYYTDSAVEIIKRNDPIMKEIKNANDELKLEPVNATIENSYITPGISGTEIDLDKSYEKMKEYGEYHSSLLVFEEVNPVISIKNNYDSYIQKGNHSKREVSLIFTMEDTSYLQEIVQILSLENTRATFFLDSEIFSSSIDALKLLKFHFHQVESLGRDKKYSNMILNIDKRNIRNVGKYTLSYCFLEKENKEILDICKNLKMHTLIPSINDTKFPLNETKKSLENGSTIHLKNNVSTLRELKSLITYIYQKGYKIVPLEELLEE